MAENYLTISDENGSVNISEDVIAVVVSAALKEVEGMAGFAHVVGSELAELFGRKSISKGVKVRLDDNNITVDVVILVRYGCQISSVALAAQAAVTSSLEAMTGQASIVNVHVSGVVFEK